MTLVVLTLNPGHNDKMCNLTVSSGQDWANDFEDFTASLMPRSHPSKQLYSTPSRSGDLWKVGVKTIPAGVTTARPHQCYWPPGINSRRT